MRHKLFFFCFLMSILWLPLRAQEEVSFDDFFENKTLRLDYYRTGCKSFDSVERVRFVAKNSIWAGPRKALLDPFDNGEYRLLVLDSSSGRPLYSYGYNTLFREYRDTKPGADSVARFEEVVLMPFPKKSITICLQKRDEMQHFFTQKEWTFNPLVSPIDSLPTLEGEKRKMSWSKNGDCAEKLDVVIVPEGYGENDVSKMYKDYVDFTSYLFAFEPFSSRQKDFNVWGVNAIGKQSGITNPGKNIQVESAVGATYYTFGSDRYLMTFNLFQLHDLLDAIPYDQIIIMANSDVYGGGAIYNFYAVSAVQKMSRYILPHELGHSIGGLADEYVDEELSYSEIHKMNTEPVEPNVTTLVDFDSKWKSMLPEGTPVPTPAIGSVSRTENGPLGVYEGAGYLKEGIYRPVMNCMMRNYAPFCPVCRKRLNEVIDRYCR